MCTRRGRHLQVPELRLSAAEIARRRERSDRRGRCRRMCSDARGASDLPPRRRPSGTRLAGAGSTRRRRPGGTRVRRSGQAGRVLEGGAADAVARDGRPGSAVFGENRSEPMGSPLLAGASRHCACIAGRHRRTEAGRPCVRFDTHRNHDLAEAGARLAFGTRRGRRFWATPARSIRRKCRRPVCRRGRGSPV